MEDETLELHFKTVNDKIDKMDKNNASEHDALFSKVNALSTQVAVQRVRSGFIGAFAGMIPAGLTAIYFYIRSLPK